MSAPVHITSPAARNVLNGRYAVCTISGVTISFLFDWRLRVNADYANLTAAGDRWKVFVFEDGDWTATARGYIVPSSATSFIKDSMASGIPVAMTFTGYTDVTATQVVWAGACSFKSGDLSAPMGLFEQTIEVIGSFKPTTGVG